MSAVVWRYTFIFAVFILVYNSLSSPPHPQRLLVMPRICKRYNKTEIFVNIFTKAWNKIKIYKA